jgi:hypothetical protein
VVHGDVADIVRNARPAIGRNWNRWINEGRLRVVERWVGAASWSDVESALPATTLQRT